MLYFVETFFEKSLGGHAKPYTGIICTVHPLIPYAIRIDTPNIAIKTIKTVDEIIEDLPLFLIGFAFRNVWPELRKLVRHV